MNSLPRFVGFSLLLLLAFLAIALSAPTWLARQSQQARNEAIVARKARLAAAVHALPRAPAQWDQAYQHELGTLVGGSIVLRGATETAPAPASKDPNLASFDERIDAAGTPLDVHVQFPLSSSLRLLGVYQKVTVGLLLFGAVLLWVVLFFAMLRRRAPLGEGGTRSPWQHSRREMGSLEQLAKTSVAQKYALEEERDNRRRAEENAQLKEGLLNRSIEERIGIGRDLHDGIIQSLYAVGLTLESVRGLIKSNPSEADQRLEQCRENLNRNIREVRAYITGLAPDKLQRGNFAQGLETLFRELGSGCEVDFDLKVDDEASALLTPEQTNETLLIAREAVSNAIRHGGASLITVRLHKNEREVCLLVQDNGTGFAAESRREGGLGLGNMQARAQRVGANTTITSKPGEGTRVVVTLTALPLATA